MSKDEVRVDPCRYWGKQSRLQTQQINCQRPVGLRRKKGHPFGPVSYLAISVEGAKQFYKSNATWETPG